MKPLWLAGIAALVVSVAGTAPVHAVPRTDSVILVSKSTKRPALQRSVPGTRIPAAVSGTAPDQAGYVHYFVITGPDGEPETQVGIELPGDRIAWSFPGTGVTIAPFMKAGVVTAAGKPFNVEHLYGLRPYTDEESFRLLQRTVGNRVAWWVGEKIPYCDEEGASNRLCVSCLGFVLRVLYPGSSPALPALPADFRSARRNLYSTEDLLLYLAGVPIDAPRSVRRKRIASLDIPGTLREELTRIAIDDAPDRTTASASKEARPAVAKPRARGRSMANSPRRVAPKRGS